MRKKKKLIGKETHYIEKRLFIKFLVYFKFKSLKTSKNKQDLFYLISHFFLDDRSNLLNQKLIGTFDLFPHS
jgi:hypothetical protein